MPMETPSKLAQARIERDFTQAKVAEYVGVDVITVCRWERGSTQPYPRHVKKVCDFFGKTTLELGLAPSEAPEGPPASLPVESHANEDNAFATLFRRDLELRLQYIMYD